MNKRVIIVILATMITMSLIFAFFKPNRRQTFTTPVAQNSSAPPETTLSSGAYINYSEQAVKEARGQKVLFFHAPWCPQCRSIESGIESQGVPEGFTIIKVDYDTNQALRQKYGITLQTTFVKINDQGEFISKYVAYDEPTFDAVKRNYL